MRFTYEKKQAIIIYILEKIDHDEQGIPEAAMSNFGINEATFYKYIKELLSAKIIEKIARGRYRIISSVQHYNLARKRGDLDRDTIAYEKCLEQHVKPLANNVERIWTYTFSEMTNNVMDHSGAEHAHVVIEKNYLWTKVWLIDDGIGIFKKIKDHFQLENIEDAVDELFKGKVTTDVKNHSGEGIFFSSRMMDEFCIISDNRIFSHDKYDREQLNSMEMPFKKGTAVMMKLSNYTRRTPKEIFAKYENDEGEFDKTEISLKMIFDTEPISRSQAKRICAGLDKFKEVVFDFDGIEWMGQGFADQVFRVFANEHGQTKLSPVNMNEDVSKMYQHVTRG